MLKLTYALSTVSTSLDIINIEKFVSSSSQPVVSLRIYNVLVQVVAIPTLVSGSGERVDSLRLRCGQHQAFWDGKYLDGKREAITGVYYYQLIVDGERFTRKMIAQKKIASGR